MKIIFIVCFLAAIVGGSTEIIEKKPNESVILRADQGNSYLFSNDDLLSREGCMMGGIPNACCKYWDVVTETHTVYVFHVIPIKFTDVACTTGGSEKCLLCDDEGGGQ